jgi:2-polyprenyl-3-methyl-5-hydroxy-6-metoxy-1,4-benzoquinol methylase
MAEYRLHHHPASSHQQIAALLRRLQRSPVLDVGAAGGFLGQLLQGSTLMVDAVEPSPSGAAKARPFYRQVFETAIETAPLPDRMYQVIVCADVLEHTVDPAAVLRRLRGAAADGALFVVSLPNVAHVAVRAMLLAGRFPKMDRGILDKTHLHFYTRQTAEDLLASAGLRLREVTQTTVPLEEIWPGGAGGTLQGILMGLQSRAASIAPRLFAYQWIFVAEPAPSDTRGAL